MTATVPASVPGLYKIRDAMQMLKMSRSVIYDQIRAGRLRTVKQGRATFITAAAITEYIELLEHEASAARFGPAFGADRRRTASGATA